MPRRKPDHEWVKILVPLSPDQIGQLDDLVSDEQRRSGDVVSRVGVIRALIRAAHARRKPMAPEKSQGVGISRGGTPGIAE